MLTLRGSNKTTVKDLNPMTNGIRASNDKAVKEIKEKAKQLTLTVERAALAGHSDYNQAAPACAF